MKYLLVVVLALGVFWLWRHNRQAEKKAAPPPTRQRLPAVKIVECAVCGVHLPQPEALSDARGSYCCEAHRRQHGH